LNEGFYRLVALLAAAVAGWQLTRTPPLTHLE